MDTHMNHGPRATESAGLQGRRQTINLDQAWRFLPEDCPAGMDPDLDDHSWRQVDLPHDYVIEQAYDPVPQAGQDPAWYSLHGHLPIRPAWYRRQLPVPDQLDGRRVYLEFDGVFSHSTVWLDGCQVHHEPSGYTGFVVEITPFIQAGRPGLLAVRTDPRYDGWWYEGGGIYRHVRLTLLPACHLAWWGIHVAALPERPRDGQVGATPVRVRTELSGTGAGHAGLQQLSLCQEILDQDGQVLSRLEGLVPTANPASPDAAGPANPAAQPAGRLLVEQRLALANPRLWDVDQPWLYRLRTTLRDGDSVLDQVCTPFGVRHLEFHPDQGFFLNGRHLVLKGVNSHQDHPGVGVALPDSLMAWRLQRLKDLGCNALRLSHNPVSPVTLDLCDRLGLLVIAENRHLGDTMADQTPPDTPAVEHRDLSALVRRDRNHPSIMLWSLCNEQWIQGQPAAARMARAMKERIRELDPDRLVTAALNGGFDSPDGLASVLDVIGVNYNPQVYDDLHRLFPHTPILASEIASEVATRGCYDLEAWDCYRGRREAGHLAAYGINTAGGQVSEDGWPPVATRAFMAGGLVWAGFDYKGEPRPFNWPCVGSHYGMMDSCGYPKDSYHYYRAWWNDSPVLHLFPHWNWPGHEGRPIAVWVHSNCETVELFLNGASLGCQTVVPLHHLEWQVPWEPGLLLARGSRQGQVIEAQVATTGPACQLALELDRPVPPPPGLAAWPAGEVALVKVMVLDQEGRVVPDADHPVSFAVTGPASLAGTGNGNPSSHEPDQADHRQVFHGLAQVLVRTHQPASPAHTGSPAPQNAGQPEIVLQASSPGLRPARLSLRGCL